MEKQGIHYNLDAMFPSEPDFYEEEELCLKDYEYLKRLYPQEVRLMASILEEYLDRYEYEGSPMYAQYPDAVTIYRIAEEVYNRLHFEKEEPQGQLKNMLQVMVCQEIYVRRRRHDKFCRKFQIYNNMRENHTF
ncbi:MAG: hypothetical protein IJ801_01425 [Lachnospiraceae bacterium]|nr:hypothetical protein [Lachnospiraceae bacterium]